MLERPPDLFPNNKIVDKTLITIEQISLFTTKSLFSPFFRALQASQGEREQRAKGGGRGGGGEEEDVTSRESRETGQPALLHACLKNVDNHIKNLFLQLKP